MEHPLHQLHAAGEWIHFITDTPPKSTPNAFYVGFEDGNSSATSFGNDGDYNDYVFFFTGLTCQGGGQACDISTNVGACRNGVTDCLLATAPPLARRW